MESLGARRGVQLHRIQNPGPLVERASAALLLLLLAPLLIILVFLLFASDGAPVLYRHRRIGLRGVEFDCLKFRTMRADADEILQRHLEQDQEAAREWAESRKLKRDPRVTAVGEFLRRSSLDELPQLINVARGEMSFVGPRPIVRAEAAKYGDLFELYCSVRPGITGLWQISGRSDTSYEQRIELDMIFIQERSRRLYFRILLLTIPTVLLQKGSC